MGDLRLNNSILSVTIHLENLYQINHFLTSFQSIYVGVNEKYFNLIATGTDNERSFRRCDRSVYEYMAIVSYRSNFAQITFY